MVLAIAQTVAPLSSMPPTECVLRVRLESMHQNIHELLHPTPKQTSVSRLILLSRSQTACCPLVWMVQFCQKLPSSLPLGIIDDRGEE